MALNTPLDRVWLVPQHGRGPRHSCSSVSPASRPPRRRKSSEEAVRERQQVVSLAAKRETSLLRFYVSREWLNKFNTFAEPGPITNHTFLCPHGGEGAFSVPRVWDGRAEPPPVPPRAFLRRHPAQQVPLHRRPGGDPAAGRLGVPVQQVRCCGQPLPGGRPAPSRAAEEDREGAATVPSAPAADGTEAVAGASLASVSELEKTHGICGHAGGRSPCPGAENRPKRKCAYWPLSRPGGAGCRAAWPASLPDPMSGSGGLGLVLPGAFHVQVHQGENMWLSC